MQPSRTHQTAGLWIPFADLGEALACATAIARDPAAWGCAPDCRDLQWGNIATGRRALRGAIYYLALPPAGPPASEYRLGAMVYPDVPRFVRPDECDGEISFLSGLALHLARNPRDSHTLDDPMPEEWLIVCPPELALAALIYHDLGQGGQRVQWALGCSGSEWHTLFWVRQTSRHANLLQHGLAQLSPGAEILAGSAETGGLIFLQERRLGATLLGALAEVAAAAPGLFGAPPAGTALRRPLFAVWRVEGEEIVRSMLLSRLRFRSETPQEWLPLQACATLQLEEDVRRRDALEAQLRALKSSPGYRLRLIDFPLEDRTKEYQKELAERRDLLQEELNALSWESPENPVIYRFEFDEIEGLAELLHEFRPHERASGVLEYAYARSAGDEGQGHHYLLAADTSSIAQLHATVQMYRREPRPRRFDLDPLWARHYRTAEPNYWILVPHQTALLPSLHAWDADELPQELARAVTGLAGAALPAKPLYLFDSVEASRPLSLLVLDRNGFEAFPRAFRLFNDTLRIARTQGVDGLVRAVADADFAQRLVTETSEAFHQANAELEGAQAAVMRGFLERSQKLHADLRAALASHLRTLTGLHEQYRYVAGLLDKFNAAFESHRVQSAAHLARLEKALVPHGNPEAHSVALMAQAVHLLRRAVPHAPPALKSELTRLVGDLDAQVEATEPRVDAYSRDGLPEHLARTLREADLVIEKAEARQKTLTVTVSKRLDELIKQKKGLLKRLWRALLFWGR
jgi:hypothetical protein